MNLNAFRLALALLLTGAVTVAGQSSQPAPPPPEQPGVTFRAEVNYVEVDARVLDAQGKFVPELSQADFQVFEDGKPQQVTVFSLVNLPVERATRPLFANKPIEPDVQNNVSGYNGRVYLIVLDDVHTSALRSQRVKMAARQFIERNMGANDVAALVHTSGKTQAAQEFTTSKRMLLEAVDKFMGDKLRSSLMGRVDEEARTRGLRQAGDSIDDPDGSERGFRARNTLESMKSFADIMAGVRGRKKALVYFSEGIDYDVNNPFLRDSSVILDAQRDLIAAATRANVAIYGIDVRGLGAGADDAIEIQSFPDDPTLGLTSSALQAEVRLGQDMLRVVSDETGGFATVNTNDITGAMNRVVDENSSYYVLGYYAGNTRRDGRFRRIEVRVNKPGLTVRSRKGYYAPRGRAPETTLAGPKDASAELREAMSSPVPVAGLPLAITASVFKGPDNKGSVVISTLIGARDLPLVEKEGTFRNDLEIAVLAIDSKGKSFPGERNTVNLTLKPETVSRMRTAGFRVISSLELPVGRYQVRVAVREANSRRSGLVVYDLEVPDYLKEPLAISGMALTSMASSLSMTARPKGDPLLKMLPAPLTTFRDFSQGDEIAMFAEVYDHGSGPAHKVEIRLTMNAEGGQTVYQTREERDSAELGGKSGGYGFNARIPLKDIAPGLYVLRLEAESHIAERHSISRETIVNVIPAQGGPSAQPAQAVNKPAPAPAPPATVPTPAPAATNVPMTTINSDRMSGIDTPQQSIVRTLGEFETLWKRHAPSRPMPTVDFGKDMVLAIFLGSRPSAGFGVQITGVRSSGKDIVVEWAEIRPAPGTAAATVMTSPAHFVTVPQSDSAVRFEKVQP